MGKIAKFFRESELVCGLAPFFRDNRPLVERWSLANADKCSADQIIAASIIQSLAKDFEDWEFSKKPHVHSNASRYPALYDSELKEAEKWKKKYALDASCSYINRALVNKKKELKLVYFFNGNNNRVYFYVNGVSYPNELGNEIVEAYTEIETKRKLAKEAADKALKEMERNEAAWNLAEKLLGMKRNEFNALVPITTAE